MLENHCVLPEEANYQSKVFIGKKRRYADQMWTVTAKATLHIAVKVGTATLDVTTWLLAIFELPSMSSSQHHIVRLEWDSYLEIAVSVDFPLVRCSIGRDSEALSDLF